MSFFAFCSGSSSPVPEDSAEKTPTRDNSKHRTPEHPAEQSLTEERERSDTPTIGQPDTTLTLVTLDTGTTAGDPEILRLEKKSDYAAQAHFSLDESAAVAPPVEQTPSNLLDASLIAIVPTEAPAVAAAESAFGIPPAVSDQAANSASDSERPDENDVRHFSAVRAGDLAYRQCLTSDEFEPSPPFQTFQSFDLGRFPF